MNQTVPDSSLAGSITSSPLEPKPAETSSCKRHFTNQPAELRVLVYRELFKYDKAIPLDVNVDGYIVHPVLQGEPASSGLSAQLLCTCSLIREEATPVLYGEHRFKVQHDNLHHLTRLNQRSQWNIKTLKIQCNKPQSGPARQGHFSRRREEPDDTVTYLPTISKAMENIKTLHIKTYTPSQLLRITLNVAKNLPCSPIRTYPTLQVHVIVDGGVDHDEMIHQYERMLRTKGHQLTIFDAPSPFGFGREMGDFDKIIVNGKLSPRLCLLIEKHVSSYGDVRFEKEELPVPAPATTTPAAVVIPTQQPVATTAPITVAVPVPQQTAAIAPAAIPSQASLTTTMNTNGTNQVLGQAAITNSTGTNTVLGQATVATTTAAPVGPPTQHLINGMTWAQIPATPSPPPRFAPTPIRHLRFTWKRDPNPPAMSQDESNNTCQHVYRFHPRLPEE